MNSPSVARSENSRNLSYCRRLRTRLAVLASRWLSHPDGGSRVVGLVGGGRVIYG